MVVEQQAIFLTTPDSNIGCNRAFLLRKIYGYTVVCNVNFNKTKEGSASSASYPGLMTL